MIKIRILRPVSIKSIYASSITMAEKFALHRTMQTSCNNHFNYALDEEKINKLPENMKAWLVQNGFIQEEITKHCLHRSDMTFTKESKIRWTNPSTNKIYTIAEFKHGRLYIYGQLPENSPFELLADGGIETWRETS